LTYHCRFCAAPLRTIVVDLGLSPLSNSLLRPEQLDRPEPMYPLQPLICEVCWLMQVPQFEAPENIFSDYVYFSSYSTSWMRHVENYADAMIARLKLNDQSLVTEIGSNDGHLLECFARRRIAVLGVEPSANVADQARARGIRTETMFFGERAAEKLAGNYGRADLIAGNNVLAHVPDINDFVGGLARLLKSNGTITMEFPHLLKLLEHTQFDTIYHEHFSYLSLTTVSQIFAAHGLTIYDVEQLATHGGSLRIFAANSSVAEQPSASVVNIEVVERAYGLQTVVPYASFARDVKSVKNELRSFLKLAKEQGKTVAGYGAPAKATTLLNYCEIGPDLLGYTVDRNPLKVGRYIPGVRIPIEAPERIAATRPDYILILPWNWADEIREQMAFVRDWGAQFVLPIPRIAVA
jgi:SAM-dependent methyltransferase